MRDIALTAVVLGSLPFILKRPQLGVLMWVWLSVMNPHRLTWSFAYDLNFAAYVAVATLLGVALSKDLKSPPRNALMGALVVFALWMGVTTIFAFYPEASFERWKALMKTMMMASLIPMLFHKQEDLRTLVWVIVVSIAYYGTKGGVFTLLGGGGRVYGPADSYIADNNAIAVAIIMVIPLMRYLQLTSSNKYVRWGLAGAMVLCGIAVLGTYSRGALLAVFAMLAFLWWKGRHKLPVIMVMVLVIPLALSVMPGKWYDRMETIRDYHNEGSAQMRLNAWGTMINIANAHPITGAGFEVAERAIYDRYSPDPRFPPQVAHSIYFEALGAHGYVGLGLYVFLLSALWLKASWIVRAAKRRQDLAWAGNLALMTQVTFVGFAVGGAFLSLVNFDVPYYLIGVIVAAATLVGTPQEGKTLVPAQGAGLPAKNELVDLRDQIQPSLVRKATDHRFPDAV